ncbi:TerD family protein [Amycolatopsis sp. cmx-8-4]|uniref:TerD family protein n=1 Tax=Amycolatopsis sp. cmx-8-4 TaxID=2790947 RepID=UPI00397B7D79
MASLRRGSNVELTREIPDLPGVVLGVRCDAGPERALADSVVLAAILCDRGSRALSGEHFVFFNQLTEPSGSVGMAAEVTGDDLEQVEVVFAEVPEEVSRIVVVLYVNEGNGLRRALGRLRELTVRALDPRGERELVRSENLATTLDGETALALGEVYRHNGGWKFKVLGEGYRAGIAGLAQDYGVTR